MIHRSIAIVASLAIMTVSFPAQASVGHGSAGLSLEISKDQRAACRSLERQSCSDFQQRLLQIVHDKNVKSGHRASLGEIGRNQLDALVASIN